MSLVEAQKLLKSLEDADIEGFVEFLKVAREFNKRVWLVGNGGSAATASHFTSDLMNLGFDVFCMVDNISRLTALTNDFSWENVYWKQLEKLDRGDVLILLSVHGGVGKWSSNLLLATRRAKNRGGIILSLVGCDGGKLKEPSDVCIIVPSESCCYVEGIHSLLTHIICERLKK